MWGLLVIVGSIALADCVNPTTVVPGAMLATRSRRSLIEFTAGVFVISFAAGAIIVIGPGPLILGHVHRPRPHTRHIVEIVLGALLLTAAGFAWIHRSRLRSAFGSTTSRPGSGFAWGAGIMLAELPTAFPYFAALAAILASGRPTTIQVFFVAFYNLLFLAPLLVMSGMLTFGGERSDRVVRSFDRWLRANVATMLPVILLVAGLALAFLGITGLIGL